MLLKWHTIHPRDLKNNEATPTFLLLQKGKQEREQSNFLNEIPNTETEKSEDLVTFALKLFCFST